MLTPEQIRKEVDEYLDWTLKQRPLAERSIQTYKRNARISRRDADTTRGY